MRGAAIDSPPTQQHSFRKYRQVTYGASKRRWALQITRDTRKGVQKRWFAGFSSLSVESE